MESHANASMMKEDLLFALMTASLRYISDDTVRELDSCDSDIEWAICYWNDKTL